MHAEPLRPDYRKVGGAFLESPVDGELVLLNVTSGTFNGLNGIALEIWRMLDETGDPARIAVLLRDRYDIAPEACEREVDTFLETLVEAGLVVRG